MQLSSSFNFPLQLSPIRSDPYKSTSNQMESLENWDAEWTTVDPHLGSSTYAFGMDHLLLEGLLATGLAAANYDSDLSGGAHTTTFDYGLDCLLSTSNTTADTTSGESASLSQPPFSTPTPIVAVSKKRKRDPDPCPNPNPNQFTLVGSGCGYDSPSGGFKLIQEAKTSISFQGQQGEVEAEADAEAIQQMKEMIYRAAAFRPVNLGADELIEKPRRKNVKISSDPQTVAARQRRERISERLRVLQKLVPGGSKMDTASMLDEAANYLKFLRSQVKALESMTPSSTNGMMPSVSFNFSSDYNTNSVPYSSGQQQQHINPSNNPLLLLEQFAKS